MLARTKTKSKARTILTLLALLAACSSAHAEVIDDARHLLLISNTADHYQSIADRQVRDIIRTYTSIVAMSADVNLPRAVTTDIASCYAKVYAWENFESGFAEILVQQLSLHEILLLIDLYKNLGHPPSEIETFKGVVSKASLIAEISADYIFSNSGNCIEHSAAAIRRFLNDFSHAAAIQSSASSKLAE